MVPSRSDAGGSRHRAAGHALAHLNRPPPRPRRRLPQPAARARWPPRRATTSTPPPAPAPWLQVMSESQVSGGFWSQAPMGFGQALPQRNIKQEVTFQLVFDSQVRRYNAVQCGTCGTMRYIQHGSRGTCTVHHAAAGHRLSWSLGLCSWAAGGSWAGRAGRQGGAVGPPRHARVPPPPRGPAVALSGLRLPSRPPSLSHTPPLSSSRQVQQGHSQALGHAAPPPLAPCRPLFLPLPPTQSIAPAAAGQQAGSSGANRPRTKIRLDVRKPRTAEQEQMQMPPTHTGG